MDILEKVINYKPFDDDERSDKEKFIELYNKYNGDVWTRDNEEAHMTVSSWVINKERKENGLKVLMCYHNIYDSWCWLGGHADGDKDLLHVAMKEVYEETSISKITPVLDDMISIEIGLPVKEHMKRGKLVKEHYHLNFTYLLEGSENDMIQMKEDENSGVKWLPVEELMSMVKEEHMKPVYQKLIDKVRLLGLDK
ncbi:MAG: NUDIX hydrolase [Clostridia bacterium]|jgi:8-oxo-dGTP pyrophosphatase MutT (NUDIX family)|nr:NUDIX hydrolase [Clostridia bacterium]